MAISLTWASKDEIASTCYAVMMSLHHKLTAIDRQNMIIKPRDRKDFEQMGIVEIFTWVYLLCFGFLAGTKLGNDVCLGLHLL